MMKTSEKAIGIFGGTFDPVHNGHMSIARSFLDSGIIDELWIFLSPFPPHKDENGFSPYHQRYKMLKAAFEPIAHTHVSDLETHLPRPSYTVQTLSYLTKKYPECSFYICMGKDSLHSFTSWHKWRKIIAQCPLLVADRSSEKQAELHPDISNVVHYVDHDAVAHSSTQVRKRIKKGRKVDDLVPNAVADIIKKENLYRS